jgi:hypothetical protein
LGESTAAYEPFYDLKNNPDKENPWEDLVEVCKILEMTPLDSMETEIRKVLDLDRTLWFLACENIFTDEDGYINKGGTDYFLYWDPETDRITPLEYDGNDTFSPDDIEWDPFRHVEDSRFPLLNKLLQCPSIRQRYLAHYRTILEEVYNSAYLDPVIDWYAAYIDSAIQADPRKNMTYEVFRKGVTEMKQVVADRSAFLAGHDSLSIKGLTISDVHWLVNDVSWADLLLPIQLRYAPLSQVEVCTVCIYVPVRVWWVVTDGFK